MCSSSSCRGGEVQHFFGDSGVLVEKVVNRVRRFFFILGLESFCPRFGIISSSVWNHFVLGSVPSGGAVTLESKEAHQAEAERGSAGRRRRSSRRRHQAGAG